MYDLELEEAVTPNEYDGEDFAAVDFDPDKQYGVWMNLRPDDTNAKVIKMFDATRLIPKEYRFAIKIVHKIGEKEDGSLFQTIGWKTTTITKLPAKDPFAGGLTGIGNNGH